MIFRRRSISRRQWALFINSLLTAVVSATFFAICAAAETRSNNVEPVVDDYKNFVTDFVPLYYFTDVPNLMRALNTSAKPMRDTTELREKAAAARADLDRADLESADAQAALNELQIRVRNLENELKQARENVAASALALITAKRRNTRIAIGDPKKRAAEDREADAQKRSDGDQTALTAIESDKTDLPKQITAARKELFAAQKNARRKRGDIILLTQTESAAFAAARADEPIFISESDATSKDPLKKVFIYGFQSRKIIYLRGARPDVDKAKNIIAFFDRPAPQARLSLWTLELNSKATKEGAKRFNKSLELVEHQLSDTRAKIATVLSFLRDCINEEVGVEAAPHLEELENERNKTPNASYRNPAHHNAVPNQAGDLRWARLFFYQPEVLMRLGFDPDYADALASREQAKIVQVLMLPDPTSTTTLGESLIILSLAKADVRYRIMENFSNRVAAELKESETPLPSGKDYKRDNREFQPKQWFALTRRALNADKPVSESGVKNENYTPLQREIVKAVSIASVPRLLKRLEGISQLKLPLRSLANDSDKLDNSDRVHLEVEIEAILLFLWNDYGVSTIDLFGQNWSRKEVADEIICNPSLAHVASERLKIISQKQNVLRLANQQIAKTDNIVKQLIDAVEEDINRSIVQPMVYDLRRKLVREKIGVGVINRTSVLATNRMVARVDPRSSAQLLVGEEQDALAQAQQLAALYLSLNTGNLLGGLDALNGMRQERQTSEIYGLNSGAVFKVTPFFDPTGQALRFQFDYTLANLVANPDNSIEPQLPRIERHTVNTEVQLNNLELREISRFEANAKVGLPTRYSGGVPIFKDVPYVKKVPLLGWFVRRSGNAAVVQQSLMLGQTTIYPTIADVFDLLSGDDYNFDEKDEKDDREPTCDDCSPDIGRQK